MRKSSVFPIWYVLVLVPAVAMIVFALLVDSAQQETRRIQRVTENSRLAAASVDLQLGRLLELTRFCVASPELVKELDLERVAQSCGRYAALLGAWVVVVETGETHRQVLNTRTDAPASLPVYQRTRELPTLLELEERSRKSGAPGLSEVFTGKVYPNGVLTAGQYLRLADGRPAMLYVSMSAQSLSEQLATLVTEDGPVFAIVDPSRRVVARSAEIDRFMFAEAPSWLSEFIVAGVDGAALDVPGPAVIGGTWDAGYQTLNVAPGWMAVAVEPVEVGLRSWAPISLPSGIALLGFLLSGLLLWLFFERDRVTQEIMQADLARQKAVRQNRDKSRLLASFAHDVRSPLISLLGSLELIDVKGGNRADPVRTARSSAEALLQLVDDILELSFLGSGEFVLHPSPVDLRRLSEDIADQTREMSDRKGLDLLLDLDAGLPGAVLVDRLRLQQVLSNLLSNAVKYTERGTVTLRIGRELLHDGQVTLSFAVIDTGIGIADEDIPRILREFGRLDHGANTRQHGAGLGLAIVQQILHGMGARLTVKSERGIGSTFAFRVDLPVVLGESIDSEARPLGESVIVYAEDEPIIRQVTARRLTEAGAHVIEAVDGADALEKLATSTPDLLLLDLQMPGIDGVGVIRCLRATAPKRNYPIFVLTSHIAGPQAAEARSAGADVIFTKPLQIAPLAAALRARRGDAGQHTPAIGAQQPEGNVPLLELEIFLLAADAGNWKTATDFISRFEHRMRGDLEQLQAALVSEDMSSAARIAHRGLGLCQISGARKLAQSLLSIEQATELKDPAILEGLHENSTELFGATITRMREVLHEHRSKVHDP